MKDEQLKSQVKDFWEQEPCGSGFALSAKFTREYFDEIEEHRYRVEPFIHQFAQFTRQRGKKVLEVGVGAGTDHLQFARAGAVLSGIDLTDAAVEMVGKRLALEGLSSDLRRSDAETLPFPDNTFDYVYSWGVLHHTPDTERALAEVHRVCKPGGRVCIMLYHRRSLLALLVWLRFALLKMKPFTSVRKAVYYHMESIGTKCYSIGEAKRLFRQYRSLAVSPVLTPYDLPHLPAGLRFFVPQAWGWFLVIQAVK